MSRSGAVGSLVAVLFLCAAPASAIPIWQDGDVITYSQASWGDVPSGNNPPAILLANYFTVYAATSGVLEVGIPGAAGFSIRFTNPTDLLNYLPALGTSGPLTSDHIDPLSTSSGQFGGEVTALKINIDFSEAGVTLGTLGIPFGDLILANFDTLPDLNGLTVREYFDVVSTLLGGGSGIYSIALLDLVTNDLNSAFPGGTATLFAQEHLVAPTTTPVPEPNTMALFGAGLAVLGLVRRRRTV